MALTTKIQNFFTKKNILITGVSIVCIGVVLGLAIGIPLSQSTDNFKRAQAILGRYPLIDGLVISLKMFI